MTIHVVSSISMQKTASEDTYPFSLRPLNWKRVLWPYECSVDVEQVYSQYAHGIQFQCMMFKPSTNTEYLDTAISADHNFKTMCYYFTRTIKLNAYCDPPVIPVDSLPFCQGNHG